MTDHSLNYENFPESFSPQSIHESLGQFFKGTIQSLIIDAPVSMNDFIYGAVLGGFRAEEAAYIYQQFNQNQHVFHTKFITSQKYDPINIPDILSPQQKVDNSHDFDEFFIFGQKDLEASFHLPYDVDITFDELDHILSSFSQIINDDCMDNFHYFKHFYTQMRAISAFSCKMYGPRLLPQHIHANFSILFQALNKFENLSTNRQQCDIDIVPIIFLIALLMVYLKQRQQFPHQFTNFSSFIDFIFLRNAYNSFLPNNDFLFEDVDFYFDDFFRNIDFILNNDLFTQREIAFFKCLHHLYIISHLQLDFRLFFGTNSEGVSTLNFRICQSSIIPHKFQNCKVLLIDISNQFLLRHSDFGIDTFYINDFHDQPEIPHVKNNPLYRSFLTVLLDPQNLMLTFKYIFSNITTTNNIFYSYSIDSSSPIDRFVILHYYPIFYNALQKYCATEENPYLSVLGCPGTGKSTMLFYIILRWFLEQNLIDSEGEFISTIIIIPNQKDSQLFFTLENNSTLIFGSMNDTSFNHSSNILISPEQGVVITFSLAGLSYQALDVSRTISTDYSHTLVIYDDYEKMNVNPKFKIFMLNSIGSKHVHKKQSQVEEQVYTPLPYDAEMKLIESLIGNKYSKQLFSEKSLLIGKNIRGCLCDGLSRDSLLDLIRNAIKTISFSQIESAITNPQSFPKLKVKGIPNIHSFIIQTTSYQPKIPELSLLSHCKLLKFIHLFNSNHSIFSSEIVFSKINGYLNIVKSFQRNTEFDFIPTMAFFQPLRSYCFEQNFHMDLQHANPIQFQLSPIYFSMKGQKKYQHIGSYLDSLIIINENQKQVFKFSKFSELFQDSNFVEDGVFYFQPSKVNYSCIDYAILEKNAKVVNLILLQITVGDTHNFNLYQFFKLYLIYYKFKSQHEHEWTISLKFLVVTDSMYFSFDNIFGYYHKIPQSALSRQNLIYTTYFQKIIDLPILYPDVSSEQTILFADSYLAQNPIMNQQTLVSTITKERSLYLKMKIIFSNITQRIPFFIARKEKYHESINS
ncbi:hypothetical protein TRFO_28087 [Tritrichomonas foetus]|uniref:Uncharacterized protein n=1 Tax=Tritrichomonas foetus TaxID=1144522 RepID=A0A1J4K0B4_9EUKA|nr:hypothetical protein TRFO_28087 [Tritrichomonas foetus]|eukprot:OHT04386.1 hypothetical protein TRFO_28087 [Tritrichomonas foetus]